MHSLLRFEWPRAAVLSMDLQAGIVSIYAKDSDLVGRAAKILAHARQAGMRVVVAPIWIRSCTTHSSRGCFLVTQPCSPLTIF